MLYLYFIFFGDTTLATLADFWNKLEGKLYLKPNPTNYSNKNQPTNQKTTKQQ